MHALKKLALAFDTHGQCRKKKKKTREIEHILFEKFVLEVLLPHMVEGPELQPLKPTP